MKKGDVAHKKDSYFSQLKEVCSGISWRYALVVIVLSTLTAIGVYYLHHHGFNEIKIIELKVGFRWEITHLFVLSVFIWIILILLYKWLFTPSLYRKSYSKLIQTIDRIVSTGHMAQFYWLLTCGFVVYVFLSSLMGTFYAFGIPHDEHELNWNPLSLTYLLLTDPSTMASILKSNTHVADIIVIVSITISVLGALLFTGLLVSVFSNFMQRRVEDYQKGRITYEFSGHIVFIGYDEILPSLVKQCTENEKDKKILIQTKAPSEQVREEIRTLIEDDHLFNNIYFYNGRRDSRKDLGRLDLNDAERIFIIGNRQEDFHDELNLNCLRYILESLSKKKINENRKPIHILIEDHTEFSKMLLSWDTTTIACVTPFNIYDLWAKNALKEAYIKNINDGVNYVIFGNNQIGSTFGLESINVSLDCKKKTVISFVSEDAKNEMFLFKVRYPALFETIRHSFINFKDKTLVFDNSLDNYKHRFASSQHNIEIEFIESTPFNPQLRTYLLERGRRYNIFACTGKNSTDLNIALFLPHELLPESHIFVWQKHGKEFVDRMNSYSNLHPIGMKEPSYDFYQQLKKGDQDPFIRFQNFVETANIYMFQGNYQGAIKYLNRTKELEPKIMTTKQVEIANNRYNMGYIYYKLNFNQPAIECIIYALNIFEKLNKIDSVSYETDIVVSLNSLGTLYYEEKNYEESKKMYLKSLEIYNRRSSIDKSYLIDVAHIKFNLAAVYLKTEEKKDCIKNLNEAKKIYSDLSLKAPEEYLPWLANCLNGISNYYHTIGNYKNCIDAIEESLTIWRQLVSEYSGPYDNEITDCLERLSKLKNTK